MVWCVCVCVCEQLELDSFLIKGVLPRRRCGPNIDKIVGPSSHTGSCVCTECMEEYDAVLVVCHGCP